MLRSDLVGSGHLDMSSILGSEGGTPFTTKVDTSLLSMDSEVVVAK